MTDNSKICRLVSGPENRVMTSPLAISRETAVGAEARLSWILSGLAGMVGAVAFLHSAGYFVTFMTGNTERAVVGHFGHPEG